MYMSLLKWYIPKLKCTMNKVYYMFEDVFVAQIAVLWHLNVNPPEEFKHISKYHILRC